MGQLLRLLHAAARRGNKDQLSDWFNARQAIELPRVTSTRYVKVSDFQPTLAAFNELHHWQQPHLHPCFPQFLALSQHINALAHKRSPFPLMGLVQIRNQIECSGPLQNNDMTIHCRFSAIERHTQGVTVDVKIEVHQLGKICLTACSTYLYRMSSDEVPLTASSTPSSAESPAMTPLPNDGELRFEENAGRQYARISGDYNPIHYYNWSARLFGFKTTIAHGMHVLALALSKLEKNYAMMDAPVIVTNQFKHPAALPCTTKMTSSLPSSAPDRQLNFKLYDPNAARRKQVVLTGNIARLR